jgi:hypothetical protein
MSGKLPSLTGAEVVRALSPTPSLCPPTNS